MGEYFLISRYSRFIIKTPFTVTAGQTTNVSVITGQTGKVEITAFATMGGKQIKAHHGIYQPIDEEQSKRIETCISKKTKPCKKRLPVGKYFVKSSYGDIKLETLLTITAGQTTRLTIDFSRTPKPVDRQALIEAGKEDSQHIQPTNMAPDTPAASANSAPALLLHQ
ncbi:MAG: hypothetical protein CR966_01900 [Pseudomonadales bacterium]|nr:MAG: hypothetical protein CR966_01900 [Pseudomonadales bacterium]